MSDIEPGTPRRDPRGILRGELPPGGGDAVVMFIQPIIDLANGQTVAVEALARFPDTSARAATAEVFAAAHAAGRGLDLEAACLRAALELRSTLPAGLDLAVNVSPDALSYPGVLDALSGDLHGVIIEITELASANPKDASSELSKLRGRGALIAVDDVSTGYAGLTRLAELNPDIIKLDRNLITRLRGNTAHIAVIEALVSLARRLGCLVLAEGVETFEELTTLPSLDVDYAQGWAIAPPTRQLEAIPASIVEACLQARQTLLSVEDGSSPSTTSSTRVAGMHHVTAALARSARTVDFEAALDHAARTLGLDSIGVSVLTSDQSLREIAAAGTPVDTATYLLSEYPATASALRDGTMREIHTDQPGTDLAESLVLHQHGMSSLLLVPLLIDHVPLGILELAHRQPHRWTTRDITHARGLAENVATTLLRLA